MAEKSAEASPSAGTPQGDGGSNWWESLLSSAKTKSAEVYSMVKKDLDEIGSAVKSEANHVYSTTSTVIGKTFKFDEPESPANVMKKSFHSFIGQVSTVLNPEPNDEDDTEVILSSGDTTMLSTYKKELEALQRVDATFLVPAYSPEYDAWRASLEGDDVITPAAALRRLDTNPVLKAQYNKLVPDAVSYDHFWERYLFRVALLQDRLAAAARRQTLAPSEDPVLAHLPSQADSAVESPIKTISEESSESTQFETPDIDSIAWEEEEFANDVELSEEQQIELLEMYEKEITTKKLTKQTSSRDIANNNTESKTTNTDPPIDDNKITTVVKKASAIKKSTTTDKKTIPQVNKPTSKKPAANADKKKTTGTIDKKKQSPKKKADVCGNRLVEDYFGESPAKDDASSNSDESWEKEFEIGDVDKA